MVNMAKKTNTTKRSKNVNIHIGQSLVFAGSIYGFTTSDAGDNAIGRAVKQEWKPAADIMQSNVTKFKKWVWLIGLPLGFGFAKKMVGRFNPKLDLGPIKIHAL